MRSQKRLNEIRQLPCVRCGSSPSQAAHSNFAIHGKSRSRKADDCYTIPLCHICHRWFDGYYQLTREQSKEWFDQALNKTNRMLNVKNDEQDDVF
ncbi:hypothetical protein MN869_09495 [Acinetobacter sp. NIPH1876]|uniref:DUF968 domain-containing protein n=1 Tax=Acinetobacter sp. NIPH1876 TaxID=2924041 RepID=UPI001FAE1E0F|nr:hypothetical protein [Acinetobacter sp. NIPH1876]MCJ0828680.1 hypothetical protein [Acinetobacter sp. NIPH1876]